MASETVTQNMQFPPLPLTLEGSSILHQMFRFRWTEWKKWSDSQRQNALNEAAGWLSPLEVSGQSAVFSMLGHKGDLLLVHFRNSLDELKAAELRLSQLDISSLLDPTGSYVSVVELGLYESTVKLYRSLMAAGTQPHSQEWNDAVHGVIQRQREAMRPRLFPRIPGTRYICFYPMDRKRSEEKNWYTLPIEERQRQMEEHGLVGRRYAGQVQQIISGSIGFDDWEWGVDLFSDDPLIFKKLIYEMRFDEVSAVYGLFGTFYIGIRCPADKLSNLLAGELPGSR